ncbi:c-type cytochrome [Pedobacter sp. L105]|uniref:c-type cytochrome n=1 Tax=Pedobacter sp. L105 TaxID=1641871 RepID=UPI00131DDBB9|nr:c-type cytochrome [Pedobacter sp. L105]
MRLRTSVILSVLVLTVIMMSAFMPPPEKKGGNLKILPKNISHEDLHKVMEGFNVALGVKCNFCHAAKKDDPTRLDFDSDEKPEKEMARNMMKMTSRINKKYFHVNVPYDAKAVLAVNCVTCHNGKAHPDN